MESFKKEFMERGGMSTEEMIKRFDAIPFEQFIEDLKQKIREKTKCREEVMHAISKLREKNELIKDHIKTTRPDLYERFFLREDGQVDYVWSDDMSRK